MAEKKVALVTGGSAGIGFETALGLARTGMTVLFTGRDVLKGKAAAERIRKETGNVDVEFHELDLLKVEEIEQFSQLIHRRVSKIDVLVNNAGGVNWEKKVAKDGTEATFAGNHLGPFLLTKRLLDLLEKSGKGARIVNVASSVYSSGKPVWDGNQNKKSYNAFAEYCNSKLANVLFTFALSRRLLDKGIEVNCLHPGVVRSEFNRAGRGVMGVVFNLAQSVAGITPQQGAQTSLHLALSQDLVGKTGGFYANSKPKTVNRLAQSKDVQERLWTLSEQWASSQYR